MEWRIKNENSDFSSELGGEYPAVILKLLANRGMVGKESIDSFFDFDYDRDILDPMKIKGMDKAVDRIKHAIDDGEKIAIFGDYDADGVTATALLFEALTQLGGKNICYYIPDRQLEGYGMNEKAVAYLKEQGVNLIVTVDCGITNVSDVEMAKGLGMDVIITDHHHIPKVLPDALVIINPNLPDCGFNFQSFAGVGVAYKLAQALWKMTSPDTIDQIKWMLDLVAIGTIADCVPLLGENRVLVKYGLIVLSKTRRIGLQEMFKVGRIEISDTQIPDTQKVAFQIAPRINASGRMDHASASYKLIIERDRILAREMALEVEAKNQERQKVTALIVREVKVLADNSYKDKKIIIATNPHWPVGILGLIAGKIADEYKKPTVVMREEGDVFIGSLRSIPEVNLMTVLEGCSECLSRFGGHAQAAGVRVAKVNMEKFHSDFEALVQSQLTGKIIAPFLDVDAHISEAEINWETIGYIEKMSPFGMGNEEPVFSAGNFVVMETKVVGNGSKHLKLTLKSPSSPKIFDSIGFGLGEKFSDIKSGDKIDMVFNIRTDEWNGNKKIQFRIIDIKISS